MLPRLENLALQCSETARILVSGPRKSGKSTLCRCLINNLLAQSSNHHQQQQHQPTTFGSDGVLFLDLDPGQPELAAPGTIYLAHIRAPLLGPSFTTLIPPCSTSTENTMLRMHYLGSSTPRDSPSYYLACVAELWSLYCTKKHLPLVVNTCGWITGSGKEMLHSLVQKIRLSTVIYLGQGCSMLWRDAAFTDVEGQPKPVTILPSQPDYKPRKSGRDLREIQIRAYMHAMGFADGQIVWDLLPISTQIGPSANSWEIPVNNITVVVLTSELRPKYIADALHGSIVAMVVSKHDVLEAAAAAQELYVRHTYKEHIPYLLGDVNMGKLLDPVSTECLGLGLVSVTSSELTQIGIRSPIPSTSIQEQISNGFQIVLVLGSSSTMI